MGFTISWKGKKKGSPQKKCNAAKELDENIWRKFLAIMIFR